MAAGVLPAGLRRAAAEVFGAFGVTGPWRSAGSGRAC